MNLLGWNWTLTGSSESFVVFDISSKSFQILFFQFPFLPGNDNKHWKERRKIFWIEFLKELLLQKGIWIGRVLFTFSTEEMSIESFKFSKCIKSIWFFSSKWSDGLFCNSMLNFFLFRLQIVFKAAQKQDYNIIHLQRLKLQTVSNRNSFYGLSTELGTA